MLAPEPLIRYCPFENSTDPLIAGPPTSPELLNTPKSPLWAKAKVDNRQIQNIRRMIRVYVPLIGVRCYYRAMAGLAIAPPIHSKTIRCSLPLWNVSSLQVQLVLGCPTDSLCVPV